MTGPRFEQTAQAFQPTPLAAIELIAEQPIRLVSGRIASCDGGSSLPPARTRSPLDDSDNPRAFLVCFE